MLEALLVLMLALLPYSVQTRWRILDSVTCTQHVVAVQEVVIVAVVLVMVLVLLLLPLLLLPLLPLLLLLLL